MMQKWLQNNDDDDNDDDDKIIKIIIRLIAINWEMLKGTRYHRAVRDVINEHVTCPQLRTISEDVRIKSAASWDVVSCTLVEIYWLFRRLYCLSYFR
jgi:hypothetical protein